MGYIKQINTKNRTYYFLKDIINIKKFDWSLLKIDKKSYKNTVIYYIGYVTTNSISDYESINSVNQLYLIAGKSDGYIEEKNENKYLAFASTDKNKEELKKYIELWNGIKNLTELNSIKKQLINQVNIETILWRSNSIQMIICC